MFNSPIITIKHYTREEKQWFVISTTTGIYLIEGYDINFTKWVNTKIKTNNLKAWEFDLKTNLVGTDIAEIIFLTNKGIFTSNGEKLEKITDGSDLWGYIRWTSHPRTFFHATRNKILIRDFRTKIPLKYDLPEVLYNFINYERTLFCCYNQRLEVMDERYMKRPLQNIILSNPYQTMSFLSPVKNRFPILLSSDHKSIQLLSFKLYTHISLNVLPYYIFRKTCPVIKNLLTMDGFFHKGNICLTTFTEDDNLLMCDIGSLNNEIKFKLKNGRKKKSSYLKRKKYMYSKVIFKDSLKASDFDKPRLIDDVVALYSQSEINITNESIISIIKKYFDIKLDMFIKKYNNISLIFLIRSGFRLRVKFTNIKKKPKKDQNLLSLLFLRTKEIEDLDNIRYETIDTLLQILHKDWMI